MKAELRESSKPKPAKKKAVKAVKAKKIKKTKRLLKPAVRTT